MYFVWLTDFLQKKNKPRLSCPQYKKNQSHYMPEVSRGFQVVPDYVAMAQDGGNVVSLTHLPLFTPRIYSWYSFLLEAESTPGP